jgi:signal peptide peptidase SppA
MNAIPHLIGRVFGTPLMVDPRYANVVADVLLDKMATGHARAWSGEGRDRRPYQVVEGIAIVPVLGGLVARAHGMDAMSGLTDYGAIEDMMMEAATDPGVVGIMLDIDSPGGEASGPFELADFIREEVRGLKPVWAVAQYQACSAAYAIGSAAERLYVAPSGDVGSIGVVMLHRDQSNAEQTIGLKYTYIFAGKGKIWGNPHEPLAAEAEAEFQSLVDDTYEQFVALVTKGRRKLSSDRIRENGARIFNAANAVAQGYADKVGVMRDALAEFSAHLSSKKPGGGILAAADVPGAQASIERHPAATPSTDKKEIPMSDDATTAGKDNAADSTKPDAAALASAERDRCSAIARLCGEAGMSALAGDLIAAGATVEDAKAKIDAAGEIKTICATAKKLDPTIDVAALAKSFADAGTSPEAARKAIWDKLADASEATAIVGHLSADAVTNLGNSVGDGGHAAAIAKANRMSGFAGQ